MKFFCKFLKSIAVLTAFVLMLSVNVFANSNETIQNVTSLGNVSGTLTSTESNPQDNTSAGSDIGNASTSSGNITGNESETVSENVSAPQSDLSSSNTSSNIISSASTSTSSVKTSSKQNNLNNSISGGNIDDGIDNSGWGTGDDENSILQMPGIEADQSGKKEIFNLAQLFWILIWPIILIGIAAIIALIYVNKKDFLDAGSAKSKGIKKEKVHKRNIIYKPRD